eukprot:gene4054-5101_t
MDDLLDSWRQACAAQGFPTNSLIASVEIIGRGGTVQRVFFPIPEESLLWAVNRE